MANTGSYPIRSFSENQTFLVYDPSTSTTSRVRGSDLVNYIVPNTNYVFSESTRLAAENTDYKIGSLIQTSGATSPGDNFASTYLVVAGGTGDFSMLNGNDLLVVAGDDALRGQLISQDPGQGASLVSMEGGPTVEAAVSQNSADIDNRVIRVSSIAEIEASTLGAGYQFSLSGGGRAGHFDIISGDFSTELAADTQNGVYIGLADDPTATTKVAKRRYSGAVSVSWFGAAGDGSIYTTEINAALQFAAGGTLKVPEGTYGLDDYLRIPSNTTFDLDPQAIMLRSTDTASYKSMLTNDADGVTGGYDANENIVVKGGIWDANNDEFPIASATTLAFGHCTNIKFIGITFLDYVGDGHALEVNGCQDVEIKGCLFDTGGVDSASAEAINIDGMYSSAQFPHFGPYDDTSCTNVLVDGNTFKGVASAVGSHSESIGSSHKYVRVVNNYMAVRRIGVAFANWEVSEICNNTIFCTTSGLTDTVDVTGILLNNGVEIQDSIIIDGNTITGFTRGTTGSSSRPIFIVGSSDYSTGWTDVVISNNRIGNGQGTVVSCVYADRVTFSANNVGRALDGDASLSLFGCNACQVTGNYLIENVALNPGSGTCQNNVITGNRTLGNMNIITGVSDILITGNIFTATSGTGVGSADIHINIIGGVYTA